jgi:hypothetical protein
MGVDPLDTRRFRAAQCRRLANSATNRELLEFLLNSAEQIELDIAQLEAERLARSGSGET